MNLELEQKFPGVIWGFSQPIEDNMEEAVSGVKGELATKVYGADLHTLEDLASQVAARDEPREGHYRPGRLSGDRPARPGCYRRPREGGALAESMSPTCRTPSRPPSEATPSPRY